MILSTDEAQVVGAGVAVAAFGTGLWRVWLSVLNERRRTQPIVIAHEAAARRFIPGNNSAWVVQAYMTNEGGGPAFNARFGVQFGGVRFPYRFQVEDPEPGNIQRVVPAGESWPVEGAFPIVIDSLSLWGRAAEATRTDTSLDDSRIYWARYENAQGQTWETTNPGDRSARIKIRRRRFRRLRERVEQRARKKAGQSGADWERRILEELRAEHARQEAR